MFGGIEHKEQFNFHPGHGERYEMPTTRRSSVRDETLLKPTVDGWIIKTELP